MLYCFKKSQNEALNFVFRADINIFGNNYKSKIMKKLLSALFITSTIVVMAQPKKDPKMAATLTPGYYVGMKNDTTKGEIQTNPLGGETDFYKGFTFKKGAAKLAAVSTKKAKKYGFNGRDFVVIPFDAGEVYIEYLAKGRVCFYEYKYPSTLGGQPIVESIYFIHDTKADESSKELREIKQISQKFYKKDIKDYMKEHKEIWEGLDKFTFNKEAIANAIRQYNTYYTSSEDVKVEVETEKVTGDDGEVKE